MKALQPCQRCGGSKTPGVRGGKLCVPCREKKPDRTLEHDRERARRKRTAEVEQLLGDGKRVAHRRRDLYVDGKKWCPHCQEYRPEDTFPERSDAKGGRAAYCRPCQRAYNQERRLINTFGITWDEYDFLLAAQNYRCAICDGKPRKHALAVDHDHKTGEIRGLLCSKCNHRLLGSAHDDPARLRKAADYLETYSPRDVFGEPKYVPGFTRPDPTTAREAS